MALTDKTKLSLPLTVALSLFVSSLTGAVTATAAAYGFRDKIMEEVSQQVEKGMVQVRRETQQYLSHYVSRERFLEWSQQERVRQDRQYYGLLNAIERLSDKLPPRR